MAAEITPIETSLVKPAGTPKDLSEAIQQYKQIQETLDKAMPDCIQKIAGKAFRKKNYWRAVKTAFNLKVECLKEERIKLTDDDWGFLVTYRAIAPNGSYSDGDGSCSFTEKSKGNMQPTLHNIRSQAHTRAFNRAVSNLVGFGEVSAEEIEAEQKDISSEPITIPQMKKLYATVANIWGDNKKDALSYCKSIIGREIKSAKELSKSEASLVIENLEEYQKPKGDKKPEEPPELLTEKEEY